MSKLEDLVPSLPLCKQIPEGSFADSALVWITDFVGGNPIAEPRRYAPYDHIAAPAPTLEEILADFGNFALSRRMCDGMVVLRYCYDPANLLREVKCERRAVITAMRMWLQFHEAGKIPQKEAGK